MDPTPEMAVQSDDLVTLVGNRSEFLKGDARIGPEVDDREAEDLLGEILEICVTQPQAVGQTLEQISARYGHGCFLRRITRQGHELPLAEGLVVEKCDVIQVAGAQKDVEKLVEVSGLSRASDSGSGPVFVGLLRSGNN